MTPEQEAKNLIIQGLNQLIDLDFDYLGLKKTSIFKMTFPDEQVYAFGIDLEDLLEEVKSQFSDEV